MLAFEDTIAAIATSGAVENLVISELIYMDDPAEGADRRVRPVVPADPDQPHQARRGGHPDPPRW